MVDDQIIVLSEENRNIMREKIKDFWYLEERGWFIRNPEIQNKLLNVINVGMSHRVFVFAGDLELHLDYLLSRYYESKDGESSFFEEKYNCEEKNNN